MLENQYLLLRVEKQHVWKKVCAYMHVHASTYILHKSIEELSYITWHDRNCQSASLFDDAVWCYCTPPYIHDTTYHFITWLVITHQNITWHYTWHNTTYHDITLTYITSLLTNTTSYYCYEHFLGEFYAIETFGSTGRGWVVEEGECSHYMKVSSWEVRVVGDVMLFEWWTVEGTSRIIEERGEKVMSL
jgi:hypothetical protein